MYSKCIGHGYTTVHCVCLPTKQEFNNHRMWFCDLSMKKVCYNKDTIELDLSSRNGGSPIWSQAKQFLRLLYALLNPLANHNSHDWLWNFGIQVPMFRCARTIWKGLLFIGSCCAGGQSQAIVGSCCLFIGHGLYPLKVGHELIGNSNERDGDGGGLSHALQ